MALPETVRVKLSSEEAGAITLTGVVVQDLPVRELVGHILSLAGKDIARIRRILLRGSLMSGATRFRWQGWEADEAALTQLLAGFPDPEPGRAFAAQRCVLAILRGNSYGIEVPRDAGVHTGRFHRGASFWDVLMETATAAGPCYAGYSYRRSADRFEAALSPAAARRLGEAAAALVYSSVRDRIRAAGLLTAELYVER
ncbi:MAG TPA: hypothetical protein VN442_12370 [Bryobacteraceae bacterium]|nr:hypothetical protein [Bryobacteraceae bacterium]